jgi:FkbM family methyltransferase
MSWVSVMVAEQKFRAPVIDGVFCHVTEHWMIDLQRGLLKVRQGSFIDVGMNIGQTLLVVKAIDRQRAYFGFEPNSQCLAYCEQLVHLNELPRITMLPVGLWSANRLVRLQLDDENGTDPSASLVEGFRGESASSTKFVPVFTFAEVSKTLVMDEIGIIKIDVEGAEWDVLQGMEAILVRSRPLIVIEILPCYHSGNTSRVERQKSIEAMMKRLDYCIMRIAKTAGARLQGLERIDTIGIHERLDFSDYVLCPRQDLDRLVASVVANNRR